MDILVVLVHADETGVDFDFGNFGKGVREQVLGLLREVIGFKESTSSQSLTWIR